MGRGPRAEEAHRRLLVVISTLDPADVASSPAGSDHTYTLVYEEPEKYGPPTPARACAPGELPSSGSELKS